MTGVAIVQSFVDGARQLLAGETAECKARAGVIMTANAHFDCDTPAVAARYLPVMLHATTAVLSDAAAARADEARARLDSLVRGGDGGLSACALCVMRAAGSVTSPAASRSPFPPATTTTRWPTLCRRSAPVCRLAPAPTCAAMRPAGSRSSLTLSPIRSPRYVRHRLRRPRRWRGAAARPWRLPRPRQARPHRGSHARPARRARRARGRHR